MERGQRGLGALPSQDRGPPRRRAWPHLADIKARGSPNGEVFCDAMSMVEVRHRASEALQASAPANVHRNLILTLAARHRLPSVYPYRYFVVAGGLVCYGPDTIDQYRRAAGYVDRILKGEKPADLPVQAPVKYELTINLKTAKALGLDLPPSLITRADEVIE